MKKNKLIYAFIFAVTMFFMGNYTVNAKDYTSEFGLPSLDLTGNITYTNNNVKTSIDYDKEDRQYMILKTADYYSSSGWISYDYIVAILADKSVRSNGYVPAYNFYVSNGNMPYADSNYLDGYKVINYNYLRTQYSLEPENTNLSLISSTYRNYIYPYVIYGYKNGSWSSPTTYWNTSWLRFKEVVFSSFDIYTGGKNVDDIANYTLLYESKRPDPTEGLTKLELTDSYSVVFKPKYENINSNADLKFYFSTRHFYDFVWNQNGELFNDLCFAGKELTYRILYDDLDLMNKSDYLEFRRNFNITEEEQSSTGSSGGGHGGGASHSFGEATYNENTNEIEFTQFENAVIYYQPEFFDYCLKKSESSQCYYEDGRVDDNYFNIYVSEEYGTGEYIESASKFINEQKNYFSVFGSFAKLGFANLPAGLRNALITIVIIGLVEGFIMWLRR